MMNIVEKVLLEQLGLVNEYADKVYKMLITKFKSENPDLTDTDAKDYIDRFDKLKSTPKITQKDITKYSFLDLKKLIDSFPTKNIPQKNVNTATVKGEEVFSQNGIEVYLGDDKDKCIKYRSSFQKDNQQPYDWCIARSESHNYFYHYRFGLNIRVFYFVINRNIPTTDPTHVVVVSVFDNGLFSVTNALNEIDEQRLSWQQLTAKIPYLSHIPESLFKPKPLSSQESDLYNKTKNLDYNADIVAYLGSYELATAYIEVHEHVLTNQQLLSLLDKDYKGLVNLYINMGHELSNQVVSRLSDSLLKNYARMGAQQINSGSIKNIGTRRLLICYLYKMIDYSILISSYQKISEGYFDEEDFEYLSSTNNDELIFTLFQYLTYDGEEEDNLDDKYQKLYAQSGRFFYKNTGTLDELRAQLMIKFGIDEDIAESVYSDLVSDELNESMIRKAIKRQLGI